MLRIIPTYQSPKTPRKVTANAPSENLRGVAKHHFPVFFTGTYRVDTGGLPDNYGEYVKDLPGGLSDNYGEYVKDLPGGSGVLSGFLIKIIYIYIFPVNISVEKHTGKLRGDYGKVTEKSRKGSGEVTGTLSRPTK
jgi:hypothetical protein